MNRLLFILLICPFVLPSVPSYAGKARGQYSTVSYPSQELLNEFNEQIRLTRELRYYVGQKDIVTVEDEVLAKIDTIIEKVEIILDMFPNNLLVHVVLLEDSGDVARIFKQKYGKRVNHIAYYSLSEDTIYISVDDAKLRVLAHEIGHAIVDHFFKVRPPYNIHELMAQFAERHITD